jgi:hypothetical protein
VSVYAGSPSSASPCVRGAGASADPSRRGRAVEGDEDALALAEQEIPKHGPTGVINTRDLTVEDGALHAEVCGEIGKAPEDVSISGNQLAADASPCPQPYNSATFSFLFSIR